MRDILESMLSYKQFMRLQHPLDYPGLVTGPFVNESDPSTSRL